MLMLCAADDKEGDDADAANRMTAIAKAICLEEMLAEVAIHYLGEEKLVLFCVKVTEDAGK